MGTLIDQDNDADHDHDRHLHEHGRAHRAGRQLDTPCGQPDRAHGQHQGKRPPRGMPRGVMRQGHRHHPARHGEHRRDRDGVAHGDQQGRGDSGPGSQRGFHISDEAPRRRLRLGELGHRESQEHDGHASGDDRQRRGDAGGHRDNSEREIEVDPRPDIRDRRGGHVGRAELAGLEVVSALAHRVSPGRCSSSPRSRAHQATSRMRSVPPGCRYTAMSSMRLAIAVVAARLSHSSPRTTGSLRTSHSRRLLFQARSRAELIDHEEMRLPTACR